MHVNRNNPNTIIVVSTVQQRKSLSQTIVFYKYKITIIVTDAHSVSCRLREISVRDTPRRIH